VKKLILGMASGVILGAVLLGAARFAATPWEDPVHYHANWAVYVDGERLDLKADRYMEDVGACVAGGEVLPTQRVHMHNNEQDVVHVHHRGVTWGHFLANLGFVLGRDVLVLDDGRRFEEGDGRSLKFIVNGFAVPEIRNRLIESGDRLLISYGPESLEEMASSQYSHVADNAEEYNELQDPASCSGSNEPTFQERIRRAFWG